MRQKTSFYLIYLFLVLSVEAYSGSVFSSGVGLIEAEDDVKGCMKISLTEEPELGHQVFLKANNALREDNIDHARTLFQHATNICREPDNLAIIWRQLTRCEFKSLLQKEMQNPNISGSKEVVEAYKKLIICLEAHLRNYPEHRPHATNDEYADLYFELAVCCEKVGETKKAIQFAEKGLQYEDTMDCVRMELMKLCAFYSLSISEFEASKGWYEKLIDLMKDSPLLEQGHYLEDYFEQQEYLARVYGALKLPDKVLELVQGWAEDSRRTGLHKSAIPMVRAQAYFLKEDPDNALKNLVEALKDSYLNDEMTSCIYMQMAQCYRMKQDHPQAGDCYRKAMELASKDMAHYNQLETEIIHYVVQGVANGDLGHDSEEASKEEQSAEPVKSLSRQQRRAAERAEKKEAKKKEAKKKEAQQKAKTKQKPTPQPTPVAKPAPKPKPMKKPMLQASEELRRVFDGFKTDEEITKWFMSVD